MKKNKDFEYAIIEPVLRRDKRYCAMVGLGLQNVD